MEGGAAHGLEQLMCVVAAPPHVYKGGRGRRPALGAPQVGGVLLGLLVGFGPLPFTQGGKGEGEGGGEGKGGAAPSPSPIRTPPLWGARHPFVGWCASLIWPISSPRGFR